MILRMIGDVALHQQLGGWKRHIGRISVLVHPQFPRSRAGPDFGRGGLEVPPYRAEKAEAEFIGEQEKAIKTRIARGSYPGADTRLRERHASSRTIMF